MRERILLGLLAAGGVTVTAATGCRDGFGPAVEPPTGAVYALVIADGAVVPVTQDLHGGGSVTLTSDEIRILPGLAYERRTDVAVLNSSFPPDDPGPVTERGVLDPVGERFILRFECPPWASCVRPDTIRFSARGAAIERSYLLGGTRLIYRRAG